MSKNKYKSFVNKDDHFDHLIENDNISVELRGENTRADNLATPTIQKTLNHNHLPNKSFSGKQTENLDDWLRQFIVICKIQPDT